MIDVPIDLTGLQARASTPENRRTGENSNTHMIHMSPAACPVCIESHTVHGQRSVSVSLGRWVMGSKLVCRRAMRHRGAARQRLQHGTAGGRVVGSARARVGPVLLVCRRRSSSI